MLVPAGGWPSTNEYDRPVLVLAGPELAAVLPRAVFLAANLTVGKLDRPDQKEFDLGPTATFRCSLQHFRCSIMICVGIPDAFPHNKSQNSYLILHATLSSKDQMRYRDYKG